MISWLVGSTVLAASAGTLPNRKPVPPVSRFAPTPTVWSRVVYVDPSQPTREATPCGGPGATQARIVPAFENGVAVGFKLFSIRLDSTYSQLGLKNGDVVTHVNGLALNTPEAALELYGRLRQASHFVIDLKRDGKPMQLKVEVRDRAPPTVLSPPTKSITNRSQGPTPTARPYELVGVLLDEDALLRTAVIRDTRSGRTRTLHERESFDGLFVDHVASGRVLIKVGNHLELILPRAGAGAWAEAVGANQKQCR